MKGQVLLPAQPPLFSTYHYQVIAGVAASANPTCLNWYYNHCSMLQCGKVFLRGCPTPHLNVIGTDAGAMDFLEQFSYNLLFVREDVHKLIKRMLDEDFYVAFRGIDDYYIPGKSWYGKRHYDHDGLICGYDDEKETYAMMAYDEKWMLNLFHTPQSAFEAGMESMIQNYYIMGEVTGIKARDTILPLDIPKIKEQLVAYLSTNLQTDPTEKSQAPEGTVVHTYLCMYLDLLYTGEIPYEKADYRILRLLWEHKNCMHMRIAAVEDALGLGSELRSAYSRVLDSAGRLKTIYAKYCMRRKDDLLLGIKSGLQDIQKREEEILIRLVEKIEKEGM